MVGVGNGMQNYIPDQIPRPSHRSDGDSTTGVTLSRRQSMRRPRIGKRQGRQGHMVRPIEDPRLGLFVVGQHRRPRSACDGQRRALAAGFDFLACAGFPVFNHDEVRGQFLLVLLAKRRENAVRGRSPGECK